MDGLQNFMWKHSEQFVYYAVWAWGFVIAKSFDAFSEGSFIKDLGWSHLLCLNPWNSSFVICDWRPSTPGVKGVRNRWEAPYIPHALPSQTVFGFLSQRHNRLCYFISDIMDYFMAGEDLHQTYQPNDLAGG